MHAADGSDTEAQARLCARCGGEPADLSVPDRVQALALDILHRLRSVCSNMPDEELLTLATRVAAIELDHFDSAVLSRPSRRYLTRFR